MSVWIDNMGLIKNTTSESINQDTGLGKVTADTGGDWRGNSVVYTPINKDKRILVQGILQAVVQSQGLLLEPGKDYITKIKETTLELVRFVEENSR